MDDWTLIGSFQYSRIILIFRVAEAPLQSRLLPPWQPYLTEDGFNVGVGFCDVVISQNAQGDALPSSSTRYIPVNGPVRNAESGRIANMRYCTYASHPEKLLTRGRGPKDAGPIQVQIEGKVARLLSDTGVIVKENYEVRLPDAGTMKADVEFARGSPESIEWSTEVLLPGDPAERLYYTNVELQDTVLSLSDSVDRIKELRYTLSAREISDIFDGNEELVAVISVPWSAREVYERRLP